MNNDLGYLYAEQGKNLEKAEAMIRKAVADEPENSAYLDSLGWVLFKRGKAKEAIDPAREGDQSRSRPTTPRSTSTSATSTSSSRTAPRPGPPGRRPRRSPPQSKPPDKRLPEIRKKLETLKKLEPAPEPATGANP